MSVSSLCFEWTIETNHITYKCLEHLYSLGFTKFYLQFTDDYTFRPEQSLYNYSIEQIKLQLDKTIPKEHWGMLWCK